MDHTQDISSSPEESSQPTTENLSPTGEGAASPEVLDLDTVQKFKWAGREWTPKDLQGQVMMQSDYTRKTQALSEERKYYENLRADLDYVKANPQAAAEFKKLYPEKFHGYLDYVSPKQPTEPNAQPLPPEVKELMDFKEEWRQERQNAYMAQINAMEAKFTAKFPMSDVDKVLMGAQEWRKQNQNAREIPEAIWEKLYKASHAANEKRYVDWQSAQVKKQKEANSEGRDVPIGGGVPAQGPRQFKSIREASEAALKEL